jgi:hypothetical protein
MRPSSSRKRRTPGPAYVCEGTDERRARCGSVAEAATRPTLRYVEVKNEASLCHKVDASSSILSNERNGLGPRNA